MIPSIVARQVRETVLDYLRTTFALADGELEGALFGFLDGDGGLFKGPYVDIRLPFRKAGVGERIPLDVKPGFEPYKHQLRAFQRLYSKDGHQPQHTLVTTGTGSGKTECFLYPVLDHCLRNREKPGVKAILLYPMNALASDQARRLAGILWDDERLRGEVTAGLYVGGSGQHGAADKEHLVDKRDVLRQSPPDILLTNYKMLDFLLLRPEDRRLWRQNGPDTLRYLVLDELHTYDGAQGSDVACLIRRLKRRLGCAPRSVCAVGTSATIGSSMKPETAAALTEFASKVFDEEFFADSVITEDRCDATETMGAVVDREGFPGSGSFGDLAPEGFEDSELWLRRQAELWLGDDALGLSRVEIGKRLERHDFLRQILKVLGGGLKSWAELDAGLLKRVPEWQGLAPESRQRLVESFVGLVSHARRPAPTADDAERTEPFLTVQAQLWLRELRHLVCRVLPVAAPMEFAWAGETPGEEQGQYRHWLPIAHCRECGSAGLATFQQESEEVLKTDLPGIGYQWMNRTRYSRYILFGHDGPTGEFHHYLCPRCLRLQLGGECDQCLDPPEATIPVRVGGDMSEKKPPRFLARCPDCGSDGALSILGSRAPSLLSVGISHLFQSDFNDDKKLLAFTDSVQDASHRAGYFGARTYRFNLRTAMQTVIDDAGDEGIPLPELSDRLWGYWKDKFKEQRKANKLIPTLLPADLRELDSYKSYLEGGGAGAHAKLENQLRERLSWEAVMEWGLNSKVGRTLESTLCSSVAIDTEALTRATAVLAMELRENHLLANAPAGGYPDDLVEHFLAGILHRVRMRGGIDHRMLKSYIREGGVWFLLTKKKQPLMSPFRRESVLPRFLMDRARGVGEDAVFDSILSKPDQLTWFRDWASRMFGIDRKDEGINDLYHETVNRLHDAGLLVRYDFKKQGQAWGLNPACCRVTAKVGQVVCPQCRRRVTLSESGARRWAGHRCTQYRCSGTFEMATDHTQTYYGRIYRSRRLERIYSHEHTGLLSREDRERIEEDFKEGTKPGAPNLFVCTPTLELGIDIGDLSAAMLCSVPPTTPNYLQRIGRTGRKTGNAFCMTLANSRPHDLFFHAEPMEMMAGQVLPPGCFLDAPEMLRRQIIAHGMDSWARQEETLKSIPPQAGMVLGDAGKRSFPGRFIEYYRKHREELTGKFLETFDPYLSPDNRIRLAEFANGDEVPALVDQAFEHIDTELKELKNSQALARKRIQEIENNPESVDDPEEEKRDLEDTRRLLGRITLELRNKYPLNVLTDEGVLPNYAFPEPGVKLESVVAHKADDGKWEYEARGYIRPASSAIRELAPFNTFYADGRKVKIDEIDIGSKARPLFETWRLCRECSYMRLELAGQKVESECPRCGETQWSDAGQVRTLIHFRRSRSLATRLDSSTVDDTEDRENKFYETIDLIDVGKEHYNGAVLIEELPFGYELLRSLTLREINFGLETRTSEEGFRVRGLPVGDKGFEVCMECGRVRDDDDIHHSATCKARKTGIQEQTGNVFLYREIRSEAIRILLPVSEVELDDTRATFKAALQLGFRRHFQGDPGHLIVRSVPEPVPGGYGTRQYLVVFDAVPGGTGYLSELWQKDNFLNVLRESLEALQSCPCQQNPNRDGCYRCLYAYQGQHDLPLISSRLAQNLLCSILAKSGDAKRVDTLSDVSLDTKLESELEQKFLNALRAYAEHTKGWSWEEKIKGGEKVWVLRARAHAWEICAQVELGYRQRVIPSCRPDFLIRPVNADPDVQSVAVFCDGLAYHATPEKSAGRIGDDISKRQGILAAGGYRVWSITWKDLDDFENSENKNTAPVLFGGLNSGKLGKVGQELELTLDRATALHGSVAMLLVFLQQPELDQWNKLARTYALTWFTSVSQWLSPQAGASLESRLETDAGYFEPGPLAQVGANSPVLTRIHWSRWFAVLARSSRDALQRGIVERFILRLFDNQSARMDREFETNWRAFLHTWNLLQFCDEARAVSSEYIAAKGMGWTLEDRVPFVAEDDAVYDNSSLAALLEFATEASRPLITAVTAADLPLPVDDFELPTESDCVGPEAELAWPDVKIAVLAELQAQDKPQFEAAGWTILLQPVTTESLLNALRGAGPGE